MEFLSLVLQSLRLVARVFCYTLYIDVAVNFVQPRNFKGHANLMPNNHSKGDLYHFITNHKVKKHPDTGLENTILLAHTFPPILKSLSYQQQ